MLAIQTGKPPNTVAHEVSVSPQPSPRETSRGIDGEIYRIALSPRSISWELVRDVFRIQGRPQDASIDCDILVELYLVNMIKDSVYVRDLKLSGELSNGNTVNFVRQDDLRAEDFNSTQFEYGLKFEGQNDKEPIKQLCDSLPFCLSPAQAIKGWVRFLHCEHQP